MGADLTYQCLGGNEYRLRLSFYRDCIGNDAPANVDIHVQSLTCGYDYFEIAYPIPGTGQEITPICPSDSSTCKGGMYTGIQEWIYECTILLPAECSDWEFSYTLCCRNGAITTIDNPLGEDIHLYSMLNNTNGICNNSPTFENKPVPFICLGQTVCYNNGSSDVDGDSLVYTAITPLTSGFSQVMYLNGYSPSQPLNSVPAATLDSVTGDFCITPQSLEVTVMAILVSEYRNGVLIGQVERDIQITVMNCTNILPLLSGINGTSSYTTTACAGAQFCFTVSSADVDVSQNVSISWDATIANATFTASTSARPVGTFCWTPTAADVSTVPHCFTVTVKDDACPFVGSQVFSYCITVSNVLVDAGLTQSIGCNDQAVLTATASGMQNLGFLWNTGATTASISAGTGFYTVTASEGMCRKSDTVSITSIIAPTAAFSTVTTCGNGPVQFTDSSFGVNPVSSWQWFFGDGTTSGVSSPLHQYAAPGIYPIMLIVQSGICIDTVWQSITVSPGPSASFTAQPVCPGQPVTCINNSAGSALSWHWYDSRGVTSSLQAPEFTYTTGGSYNLFLVVTDSIGCQDTASLVLQIPYTPVVQITPPATPLCGNSAVTFNGTSSIPVAGWNWTVDNVATSVSQQLNVSLSQGNHSIMLSAQTSAGCSDTAWFNLNIPAPFVAGAISPQSVCQGSLVNFNAPPGTAFLWSTGQTGSNLQVNALNSANFILTVTNANGCTDTTLAQLTVYPLPTANAGADADICEGDTAQLNAGGGSIIAWSNGLASQSILVHPAFTSFYAVTVSDTNGCTDMDSVTVNVHANPSASFTASNSCISRPVVFTNNSNGATVLDYYWDFGDGNTMQHVSNPSHAFAQANQYQIVLLVTDSFGCLDSAAIQVTIVPDPVVTLLAEPVPECNQNITQYSFTTNSALSSWNWDLGAGLTSVSPAPDVTYTIPGNYTVSFSAMTVEGCPASASVTTMIDVYPLPVAQFTVTGDPMQFMPLFFNSFSQTATEYLWNFGDGTISALESPQHVYIEPGNYEIQLFVNNDYGCRDTASEFITVKPGWTIWIPNAFTPNESGLNDEFTIRGYGISEYVLSIYNRWGELIFTGKNQGWNGRIQQGNSLAQQDVYVYRFKVTNVHGETHEKTGRVTLIR